VIVGAYSLSKNDYDGHALEPTFEQVERVSGYWQQWPSATKDSEAKRIVAQPKL